MNKVVLIGRFTEDPDLKYTPSTGTAVASFRLAVNRRALNKDGEREADFISCIVFGKMAEATATHMKKGRLIGVSGRLQTRSYDDKQGIKRYVTEVV
jgi:single-strand DNA-binding protein